MTERSRRLCRICCGDSILPEPPIIPEERLSRFILDEDHFTKARVKWRAFVPPKARADVSVARTEGWDDAASWRWADKWVRTSSRPDVFARSDITAAVIATATAAAGHMLRVVETEPDPPSHANIIDWPSFDEHKELRDLLAKELAAIAGTPVIRDFAKDPAPALES